VGEARQKHSGIDWAAWSLEDPPSQPQPGKHRSVLPKWPFL